MSRKLLIAATIALSAACVPCISNAEDAGASEMSKDSWLSAMAPLLPDLICKGFMADPDLKKRFDEIKMSYEQCVTLIPESEKKCQSQIYADIPDKINSESASVWGKKLGECIGKDFAEKYLVPKS